jgi:hypothetical protein
MTTDPTSQTESQGLGGANDPPTSTAAATLTFAADFTQTRSGILAAGGTVTVAYADSRLAQCAWVEGGLPRWDVTGYVQFDSGELFAASVRDKPVTFTVPTDGATQVAVWFEATNIGGCHAYDSNYGNNFVFPLQTPPKWLGLPTNTLSRDSSVKCGAADAATGFSFDTWARERAVNTNLCFQVYQPGETDLDNPQLWQELDTEVHWRLVGANSAATVWTTSPVNFDARLGNNANYVWDWRAVDPFRAYHCPEVASSPTSDGMYQQISVEYWVAVNGAELRPEPGAAYAGTFVDYPSDPWRTANCN